MSNRGYIQIQLLCVIALLALAITVYAADEEATLPELLAIQKQQRRELLPDIEHSHDLRCGMCIAGGYDFCWKSLEGGTVLDKKDAPFYSKKTEETSTGKGSKKITTIDIVPDFEVTDYVCCASEVDPKCEFLYADVDEDSKSKKDDPEPINKNEWICSFSFGNSAYSMHICPFIKEECGSNSIVNFYKENQEGAIHIKDLDKGDACVYNIQSVCGAPAVRVNNGTGTQIWYSEWQQNAIPMNTQKTGVAFDSADVKTSSPKQGMPVRSHEFILDEGEGSLDGRDAVYGEHKQVGWKSWGNDAQTSIEEGSGQRYVDTDSTCSLRNMQIAVVSLQDNVELLLEVESQKFSAIYLKLSMAALFSVLSIYYI